MFDQRAKTWDSDPLKVERARVVAEAIRHAVPLGAYLAALEYGCGTGLLSFALRPWLGPITLADTSQGMLDVLSEKIEAMAAAGMTPLRLDLCLDPLPADRFDLVYSLMTLHHIPDTDAILGRFQAVLKPGGWLCIADLEKEDGSFHAPGAGVHAGFARPVLKRQAEQAGFTRVRFSRVFVVKKLVAGQEKGFPLFLMTALKPEA